MIHDLSPHRHRERHLRIAGDGNGIIDREREEPEFQHEDGEQLDIGVVRDERWRARGGGSGD